MPSTEQPPSPEQMRTAVAGYVQETHRAYVDQARMFPPAVRGRMPLLSGGRLTVAAVATRNLHLLATHEAARPAARSGGRDHAPAWTGWSGNCASTTRWCCRPSRCWTRRTARRSPRCEHALGVSTVVYHIVASPGFRIVRASRRARRNGPRQRALVGGARPRDDPVAGARARDARGRVRGSRVRRACCMHRRCWQRRSRPTTTACRRRRPTPSRLRCGARCSRPSAGARNGRRRSPRRDRGRRGTVVGAQRGAGAQAVPVARAVDRRLGTRAPPRPGQEHRAPVAAVPGRRRPGRAGPGDRRLPARPAGVRTRRGRAQPPRPARRVRAGARRACASRPASRRQVGVLDGHEVVYVERLESSYTLRLFTETGRRVPVHCTSSGKVLLAFLPDARRAAVLADVRLDRAHAADDHRPGRASRRTRDGAAPGLGGRGQRARGRASRRSRHRSATTRVRSSLPSASAHRPHGCPLCSAGASPASIREAGEAVSRRLGWNPDGLPVRRVAGPEREKG